MRNASIGWIALGLPLASVGAQSLTQRVTAHEGTVQVVYPSRPNVCGDGRSYIQNVFGQQRTYAGGWSNRPCVHGPARVVVSVMGGEVVRLRTYVGPVPTTDSNVATIEANAGDAAQWLGGLLARGEGRVASDAALPLVLADAPDPWPLLLGVARDDSRSKNVRTTALTWLAMGVNDHLGLSDAESDSPDDQMRKQAVFVLSQRPKSESVPELIEVARNGKHPAARQSAIFWLGQTGDPRAADLFSELLSLR